MSLDAMILLHKYALRNDEWVFSGCYTKSIKLYYFPGFFIKFIIENDLNKI